MTEVLPVSNKITMPVVNSNAGVKATEGDFNSPVNVDLTEKYSQDEIKDILKRVGTSHETIYPCRYSVDYYPKAGALAINNTNMTNDTTEILKDGSVRHCGSWHNKEVAPKGSFPDIVEDAKARMEKASGEDK